METLGKSQIFCLFSLGYEHSLTLWGNIDLLFLALISKNSGKKGQIDWEKITYHKNDDLAYIAIVSYMNKFYRRTQ